MSLRELCRRAVGQKAASRGIDQLRRSSACDGSGGPICHSLRLERRALNGPLHVRVSAGAMPLPDLYGHTADARGTNNNCSTRVRLKAALSGEVQPVQPREIRIGASSDLVDTLVTQLRRRSFLNECLRHTHCCAGLAFRPERRLASRVRETYASARKTSTSPASTASASMTACCVQNVPPPTSACRDDHAASEYSAAPPCRIRPRPDDTAAERRAITRLGGGHRAPGGSRVMGAERRPRNCLASRTEEHSQPVRQTV